MVDFRIGSGFESAQGLLRDIRGRNPQDVFRDPELKILAVKAVDDRIRGTDSGAFQQYVSRIAEFIPDPQQATELAKSIIEPMVQQAQSGQLLQRGRGLREQATAGTTLPPGVAGPTRPVNQGLLDRATRFELAGLGRTPQTIKALLGDVPKPVTELDKARGRRALEAAALSRQKRTDLVPAQARRARAAAGFFEGGKRERKVTERPGRLDLDKIDVARQKLTSFAEENEDLLSVLDNEKLVKAINQVVEGLGFKLRKGAVVRFTEPLFFGNKTLDIGSVIAQLDPVREVTITESGAVVQPGRTGRTPLSEIPGDIPGATREQELDAVIRANEAIGAGLFGE